MKKNLVLTAILLAGKLFRQETNPKIKSVGDLAKKTYPLKNKKLQQEARFQNSKSEEPPPGFGIDPL